MRTLGQIAYEAYCENEIRRNPKAFYKLLRWYELSNIAIESWEAAARAVERIVEDYA
jgi:hypothetical protein